jgi:heptose I phosphotransferase
LQSCLAVEELTGMLPLHEAVPAAAQRLSPVDFARWKRGLVADVARLARELHRRRWFHKDLYLCHYYIPPDVAGEWRGKVHLIDLHRLTHHPWTRHFWRVKDLSQLAYSSEIPGVTARDRLRFWHCYLGADRDNLAARWLRAGVLFKWGRYRAHNLKKRQRTTDNGSRP